MSNKKLLDELLKLDPSALIELYEVDVTPLGGDIQRFHNGSNELEQDVVWQGNTYFAFPIQVEGFELTGKGQIPRPTLTVSNILGTMTTLLKQYKDLIGVKFTRKRTFLRYLDAVNFDAGNVEADPAVEFEHDVYYISRKSVENNIIVEFELTASWDLQGVKIPRRVITQNVCPWKYRGEGCGYAGADVADVNDNLIGSGSYNGTDSCGKKLKSCEIRFGTTAVLPYGGFPGAGLLR